MLFDLSTHYINGDWFDNNVRDADTVSESSYKYVVAGIWGEHCVECGVPHCYDTCKRFERTFTGWCRRFERGIAPVRIGGNVIGYSVHFRPWGKLEMKYSGFMRKKCIEDVIAFVYRNLSRLLITITKIVWKICGKKTPLTALLRLHGWFSNVHCVSFVKPEVWVISCYAYESTELIASISEKDRGDVFVRRLALKKGYNHYAFDVRGVPVEALFRIYSIDGTHSAVVFKRLEIAAGVGSETQVTKVEPDTASYKVKGAEQSAQYVKCLVWDLDNTLWQGILVEDGQDAVHLKSPAIFAIKELDKRGILNSICSKNDFSTTWPVIEKMGLSEYFVFPKINWNPKSQNIQDIAKEMNIGLNAIAFIDDSYNERGEVAANLPMVRVFDETQIDKMLGMDCFNPPLSNESSTRRLTYLAEMERSKSASVFQGSREDFLRDSMIVLSCNKIDDAASLRRCWELVNRTNQLTLAAHRYSESEFASLVSKCDAAYLIRCKDKYGDYGIVGFIAFNYIHSSVEILEFVMSCRVAKKLCEQSVLLGFADRFKAMQFHNMRAKIVSTGRNGALIEAFDHMIFDHCEEDGLERLYIMNLSKYTGSAVFRNPVSISA